MRCSGNFPESFQKALEILSKRWTGLILFVLAQGPLRFNEIAAQIGVISDRMLSQRLKELEARLDPALFVRLARGTLANLEMISRISPMPGGTYLVTLTNNQQLPVSRLQSRVLRDQLLRL